MDQLKEIGRAIKNSPNAIRKKFDKGRQKLDEDWYHSQDPVVNGVIFYVKYLGSTDVALTHGAGSTDDAVKTIMQHAKQRKGKLQKVEMTVSSRYLKLVDITYGGKSKLDEVPLYRVSYCTVDPAYDKVFCYINRNGETKQLECHAFLCNSSSKAEAITLTVAQAFNIAYEQWQAHKKKKTILHSSYGAPLDSSYGAPLQASATGEASAVTPDTPTTEKLPLMTVKIEKVHDISPPKPQLQRRLSKDDIGLGKKSQLLDVKSTLSKAVSLDYLAVEDDFDVEFTRLAEARSNPRLPIGDHIEQKTMSYDVAAMMKGERAGAVKSHSLSEDDLLEI